MAPVQDTPQISPGPGEAPKQNPATESSSEYATAIAPIIGQGTPSISDTGRTAKPSVIHDLGNDLRRTFRRNTESFPLSYDGNRHGDLEKDITGHLAISAASSNQRFLPYGHVEKLIDEESVRKELKEFQDSVKKCTVRKRIMNRARGKFVDPSMLNDKRLSLDNEAARICGTDGKSASDTNAKSYKRILAILLLIDRPSRIQSFLEEGVSDQDLPLESVPTRKGHGVELRRRGKPDTPLQCFKVRGKRWRSSTLRLFERYQWTLSAPFFAQDERKLALHYPFSADAILPFTTWQDIGRQGSYGKVYKANIHPHHHCFHIQHRIQPKEHIFAVKQLRSTSQEDEFRREFDMLRRASRHHHPHLITLLATYEQCGSFYLIFPFADSDLEEYWRNDPPTSDYQTVAWLAEQCRGLIGAVAAIHRNISPKSDGVNKTRPGSSSLSPGISESFVRCRHGDIKPKNILLFSDSSSQIPSGSPRGILKITDFGAAELTDGRATSSATSSVPPTTPNYRAPEADIAAYLSGKAGPGSANNTEGHNNDIVIGTSYDIWALGCVFLEFIAWFYGPGWKGVEDFYEKRSKEVDVLLSPNHTGKYFVLDFDTGHDSNGTNRQKGNLRGVRVNPEVEQFVQTLHNNPRTSLFFHEFLDLILEEMLVVEQDVNLNQVGTGGAAVPRISTSNSRRRSTAENIENRLTDMLTKNGEGSQTVHWDRSIFADPINII